MKTGNNFHELSLDELEVLEFLKNLKQYAPENFDYLIFYGASARELIKFLEYPEKYGNFDFAIVCYLFDAIHKIFRNYIIESPEIPAQTEADRIVASILMYSDSAFHSIYAKERLINKSHLFAYLMRKNVIFKWNAWLLLIVQRIVAEMKSEMQIKFETAG